MEAMRATEEWQRAGAYYVRIQAMAKKHHITLRQEFDEHDAPETKYIVILDDDFPIATARMYQLDGKSIMIGRVVVLPEYRHQGIGTKVIHECEQWALELGYQKAVLESRDNKVPFYQQIGYEECGEPFIEGETFRCVRMEKVLRDEGGNMAVDIIRIDETTWSFEEPGVRFFLLTGTERALLIDSGMQTRDAKELAKELTALPLSLLNTHADPDHIGSNDEFDSFYMHPAEASNYYNTQKRTGTMLPVWDGDVIDLGDRPLRIITLPGHTPGSIAVLDEKNRRIFTGDPVQDGRIFMFGVQRELHAYRHSLLKLQKYPDAFDMIYPSHGTCPVKPTMIMELYEAAGKILDGQIAGQQGDMFGNPIVSYDAGPAVFLCEPEEKQ